MASDVTVWEQGSPVSNLVVSCPTSNVPRTASIVLSFDISGSMDRDIPPQVMGLAREFGIAFSSLVDLPPSSMAFHRCDNVPQVVSDFTTNRARLQSLISVQQARGGNDFVEHLLNPTAGALPLAARGTAERSCVLVTDAFWDALPDDALAQAIDLCTRERIRFFVVVITERDRSETGIVQSFRALAQASGGAVFEGVVTSDLARSTASAIQSAVDGYEPCELSWDANPVCARPLQRTLTFGVRGFDTTSIDVPTQIFPQRELRVTPATVSFTSLVTGATATDSVVVHAVRGGASVRSIVCTDPSFAVQPQSFSLSEGDSIICRITYTSDGRANVGATMQIREDACTWSMPMLRVSRSSGVGADGIVLVEPNGREEFLAGSDTTIIWKIADTTRRVSVDVSLDSGATWTTLSDSATGTQQRWSVPRVESDQCLARVTTEQQHVADSTLLIPFDISAVDIASAGTIALGTVHGYIMRTSSGYITQTFWSAHTDTITDMVIHPTEQQLLITGSVDGRVQIHTNEFTTMSVEHGAPVRAVDFSSKPGLSFSAGDDGRILEWSNSTTPRIVASLGQPITGMRHGGADTLYVRTGDSSIRALRATDGAVLWARDASVLPVAAFDLLWSDPHYIAVALHGGGVAVLDNTGATVAGPFMDASLPTSARDVALVSLSLPEARLAVVGNDGITYEVAINSASVSPLAQKGIPARCVDARSSTVVGSRGAVFTGDNGAMPTTPTLVQEVNNVSAAMLTREGERAVTLTEGGYLFVWDVDAARPTAAMKLQLPPRESPTQAQPVLSPRGLFLATNPSSSTVARYDLTAMSPTPLTTTIADEITMMQFDPNDDGYIAVAGSLGISLLDVPTLLPNDYVPSTSGACTSIAWSPTSASIAVVENEDEYYIIDLVTGRRTDVRSAGPLWGAVRSIAWTADASRVVVACRFTNLLIDGTTAAFILRGLDAPAMPREASVSPYNDELVVVYDSVPDPVRVFETGSLTPRRTYGASLGSGYAPRDGRYAQGTQQHVTGSSGLGLAIVRNLSSSGQRTTTDVSDTLFSIVWPRLATRDVDMQRVRVGARRDSTVVDVIRNATRFSLNADSLVIVGPNADEFRIVVQDVPGTVPAQSIGRGEVSFTPRARGIRTAQCRIFIGRDTAVINLRGEGIEPSLAVTAPSINMGVRLIGSSYDSSVVVVRNITDAPARISSICLVDNPIMPFRVLEPTEQLCAAPRALPAFDSIVVSLRFTPNAIGRTSTYLEITTDDGLDPYVINVTGTGLGPTVAVRSDSGYPGDRRPITLVMRGASGFVGGSSLGYAARLRYDRSVVVPDARTTEADGTLALRGTWTGADSIITQVPATITLGRADSSTISLTSFVWLDDAGDTLDRDVLLEPGKYRVLGVCKTDRQRLFDPNAPSLTLIRRASGIDVDIPSSMHDDLQIDVLTLDGRCVVSQRQRGQEQRTRVTLDLDRIAHGVYVIRVVTPTRTRSQLTWW
jgi:WD40 repeat protein